MGDSYRPSHARGYDSRPHERYEPPPPPPPPYGGYPPAPPPPPPAPNSMTRHDHYDPGMRDRGNSASGVPPPPPLSSSMRRFGSERNERNGFDFASARAYPNYPDARDSYRPADYDRPARRRQELRDRNARDRRGPRRGDHSQRRDGNFGRPFKKAAASERALLRFARGSTPPQLEGMNNGETGAKYLDFDDLSDVEEQDMDQSADEEDSDNDDQKEPTPPPKPKWSNAELYTSLPPPDVSQRNKKDMVQLIRKARIQPSDPRKEESAKTAAGVGSDFISLAMSDDEDEEEEESEELVIPTAKSARSALHAEHPTSGKGVGLPSREAETVDLAQSVASRLSSLKRKRDAGDDDDDALLSGDIRPPSKSLKRGPKPDGTLLPEWQLNRVPVAVRNKKAIPWQRPQPTQSTKLESAPNMRLHHEIVDFYHFVQPKSYERAMREDLLHRLELFIRRAEPVMDCKVVCFGSFALGIYLPDADMDVAVVSKDFRNRGNRVMCQTPNKMRKLAARMRDEGLASQVEVIPRAKVPIIKIIDRSTSLKVDISFENLSGVAAIDTFTAWKQKYPAMPILVTVVKQFLLIRGLNDVSIGGLGGFAVTCLVTSLLQHLPRVQSGEVEPEQHLGEMLVEFLDFYGSRFDRYRTAIRMDPPALLPKSSAMANLSKQAKTERLMVIDPNDERNDISGGTSEIALIFSKFRQAKDELLKSLEASHTRPSLIDWMLGGNYDSFLWYRRRLKQGYEFKFGPSPPEDPIIP